MTVLWLALRLVRAGGRLRAVSVAGGCALGTLVLLIATGVVGALPLAPGSDNTLATVALIAVTLPVVALLAGVARLSASTRDRRLAALRILGVPAMTTRLVATTETALLGSAGALVGVVAFLVARGGVVALDSSWRDWFAGAPLAPAPWGWIGAGPGVVVVAVLVALAPGRQVIASPLAARRQASTRAPHPLRLLPLVTGVGLLIAAVLHGRATGETDGMTLGLFLSGATLTGLGLPLAIPVGVRLLADVAVRWGARPSLVIAARRLQQEPAGTTRLVGSLLVSLFVLTGAFSAIAAFVATPQYQRAERAAEDGPQAASVEVAPGAQFDAAALASTPGVRVLTARRNVPLACTPEETQERRDYGIDDAGSCGTAIVATCAELPGLTLYVTDCVDGRPTWLLRDDFPVATDLIWTAPTAVTEAFDGERTSITARLPLPPVSAVLHQRIDSDDPNWTTFGNVLLLPPDSPGIDAFVEQPVRWLAVLDGGPDALAAITEAAATQEATVVSYEDLLPYEQVQGYLAALFAAAAVLIGVGLLTLLITTVDRAVESRRHEAALRSMGVPASVLRTSRFLQSGAPLLLGLPLAGAAGLLTGYAFLTYGGSSWATPWTSVGALTAIAVLGAVLVAGTSSVGVGRLAARDLRRE